jgi:hypothetical protein
MRKVFLSKVLLCISLILIFTSMEVIAGPRDHNGGFFLRLSAGGGYAQSEYYGGPAALKISGVGGDMNFAIGMGVLPNLSVHATIFGWFLPEPTGEMGRISADLLGDVMVSSFGAGVTYYIMPANVYLSASVGAAMLSVDVGFPAETDIGPAFDVTLGKEWWVGGSWGLGVAAGFGYHSVPDQGIDENWSGYNLVVRFTATLN